MAKRCHLGKAPTYSNDAATVENPSGILQDSTACMFTH